MGVLTCKVDNQGRVMLPADWRKRFRVEPSATLVVTETESGALIVETREQGLRRAQAMVARYVAPGAVSMSEELSRERREATGDE